MNMKTSYEQIVDIDNIASQQGKTNIAEVIALGESENLPPAQHDSKKTLLLAIDVQNDFMEGIGNLPVPGSKGDVERLTRWIYNNAGRLTQIVCSLDTHSAAQIFHPCWWTNPQGLQPAPFTIITYNDVLNGKWLPVDEPETLNEKPNSKLDRSLDYLKNLESTGKKQLCIWPYHCLSGTYGADLEGEFTRMLYFHAAARRTTPVFAPKGQNPWSEMYGIIRAEYDPEGFVNTAILDAVAQAGEVYIAGEASSHCVLASVTQILEHFADQPEITRRIILLADCTSPIPGFEEATNKAFIHLQEQYGMRIISP